jgi:hypothetical protein
MSFTEFGERWGDASSIATHFGCAQHAVNPAEFAKLVLRSTNLARARVWAQGVPHELPDTTPGAHTGPGGHFQNENATENKMVVGIFKMVGWLQLFWLF